MGMIQYKWYIMPKSNYTKGKNMKRRERYKHLLNFSANVVTILIEIILYSYVWYTNYSNAIVEPFYRRGNWAVIALYALIIFFFTYVFGGYKIGYTRTMDIALCHVLAIGCSGGIAYMQICMLARDYVSILPIGNLCIAEIVFILPWLYVVRKLYRALYPPKQTLVIYGEYSPEELISKINTRKDQYNICGTISCHEPFAKITAMMEQYEAVVLSDLPGCIRNDLMKYCYEKSIRTYVTPKISDLMLRSASDIHMFDTPLLLSRNNGMSIIQEFFKRVMDIVVSLVGIVAALPVMLIIALAVKVYDGGPVFYKQARMTKDGREFMIYKFRSMAVDSETKGVRLAAQGDQRITPVGNIIRNIHFDELPQLFNILKGEMSVVGPRPERKEIAEKYLEEVPEFNMRLKVKAGLTGYAQVYGKYNTTPCDKLKLDITYINNYSFWLDIKIMLLTFKILFQKENTEGISADQVTAIKTKDEKR